MIMRLKLILNYTTDDKDAIFEERLAQSNLIKPNE